VPAVAVTPETAIEALVESGAAAVSVGAVEAGLGYPYTWLDAYILDAMCELGVRHSNPVVKEWTEELYTLASRAGLNELINRAAQHASALS
jgi:hypothetical protein